jgi:hypothetical protein
VLLGWCTVTFFQHFSAAKEGLSMAMHVTCHNHACGSRGATAIAVNIVFRLGSVESTLSFAVNEGYGVNLQFSHCSDAHRTTKNVQYISLDAGKSGFREAIGRDLRRSRVTRVNTWVHHERLPCPAPNVILPSTSSTRTCEIPSLKGLNHQ